MISKDCFTAAWIDNKSKELQYNDKNIIEKVIRAFSLLDMLAQSGCPSHFKGGSCLMLLLKDRRHRLSIDIDIICPPGTDIEQYLKAYKDYGFIDYKSVERIQRGTDIPKTHSKFFYQVSFIDDSDRQESILLDVLNENAIVDTAHAAYVATLLEKGQTEIERYNGDPMSIASLEILSTLPNRLNRLKRQSPEAYYYWAKTSQLV